MKKFDNMGDLARSNRQREEFLEFGPLKGEGMLLDGRPVVVVDVNDFGFTVTVRTDSGALVTVLFERLTRPTD